MTDGNGKSVSWQSFGGFAVFIAIAVVGWIGNGMKSELHDVNGNLGGVDRRLGRVEDHLDTYDKEGARRDAQLAIDRVDIDVLKEWHQEQQWEKEHESHKRDMNQLEKKNRRKDMVVRQKTFALKHAAEHEDHVVKKLTEDLVKGAPSAEATP